MIEMNLHTDDFPLSLNRAFYDDLIGNFKLIQKDFHQLDENLDQEISNRISADNREAAAREAADQQEAAARASADQHLQSEIDALDQRMTQAEGRLSKLETRITKDEDTINKLYEAVFGIPSAILNEASSVDDDDNDVQPLEEINTERNGILDAE